MGTVTKASGLRLLPVMVLSIVASTAGGCGGSSNDDAVTRTRTVVAKGAAYQRLVKRNYTELTPEQSRKLVQYAARIRACMRGRLDLGRLRTSPTKIVMALPAGTGPDSAVQAMIGCTTNAGDPPARSTLQVRGGKVMLYLPKYCILDRKIASSTGHE